MDTYRQYVCSQIENINLRPDIVLEQIDWFVNELLKWNKSINLTSITDIAGCWEKHIQDSLLILPYVCKAQSMLDMGSGAGLPAIPVKLVYPDLYIVSVDKVRKKINFQNHCKRYLNLIGFEPTCSQLNVLQNRGQAFDVVIARALASIASLVEYGAEYVKPGGILVAMKSRIDRDELQTGLNVGQEYNLELEGEFEHKLMPSQAVRKIIVLRKTS